MSNRLFILDTDIGSDIDDAMALLLCLRINEFPLIAITTVYNCSKLRAKIAYRILEKEGKHKQIPVGSGVDTPLDDLGKKIMWSTGNEGKGILTKNEVNASLDKFSIMEDGVNLSIEKAKEFQSRIEIISTGQFTNIATAIQRDGTFVENVKRIWSMSAGVTYNQEVPGNFPEPDVEYFAIPSFNVRCDIKAAEIVVRSGIPIVFVGNDVTTKVEFSEESIKRVRNQGSPLNNAVMDMMELWLAYRSKIFEVPITKTCLHDALVVAEAMGKNFTEKIPIDIEINKDMMGATVVKYNPNSKHQICWTVDSKRFEKFFLNTICSK